MNNLLNRRFGKLTVLERDLTKKTGAIYWICQCDCGNKKSIRGSNLLSKTKPTQSCGCLLKDKQKIDMDSLVGKQFGKLIVISRDLERPIGHGFGSYWLCKCSCGNTKSVLRSNLVEGKTKSCGCLRKELLTEKNILNLENKRYGKVQVLNNTGIKNDRNSFLWRCQCDCGNIFQISAEYLQSGHVNSCGCSHISSKGEDKIDKILRDNDIVYAKQFTFQDCRNPKTNKLYRYDFAILDKNNQPIYLIEYDGEQHFLEKNKWHFDIKEIQFNDNYKNEYAKNHNIKLIRIPYTEYKNLSLELIFSNKYLIK